MSKRFGENFRVGIFPSKAISFMLRRLRFSHKCSASLHPPLSVCVEDTRTLPDPPLMSPASLPTASSVLFARRVPLSLLILGWLSISSTAQATINEDLWKLKYGVTPAQWSAPGFLTADDDKDGIKNGDEIAAGTSPFNATKTIKVASMSRVGNDVVLEFPTEDGKRYRIECTSTLSVPGSWVLQPNPTTPAVVVGNGSTKTLAVPYTANCFYRVRVDDADSDGDGVGDWAEKIAGFNPNDPTTDGNAADATALANALVSFSTPSVVTVTVTKPSATQPPSGQAAVDVGSILVSRTGLLKLGTLAAPNITVPLQISGTAIEGTDYFDVPSVADFTAPQAGQVATQVVIPINPKANASRKTNATAIIKAVAGGTGSYTVGPASSGAVVINPAGIANGTGLTGSYHNASSSTYSPNQTDIFAGPAEMTRTDATIDFNGIASISTGNPCTVTTKSAHGLVTGTPVTIQGVTGGTFSPTINGRFVATVTGANTFTVASNCTVVPTSLQIAAVCGVNSFTSISIANPCVVTTRVPHGFGANGTVVPVSINWLNGGTFTTAINSTFNATVTGPSTFTMQTAGAVNVGCTVAPSAAQLAVGEISGPRGVNGWGSTSGPIGMSSPATGGAWSVRWTGQVMPQYSETYTFDVRSSASAKVWVDGKLLVDRWATGVTAQDYVNTITLKAGTLYDIQVDYWQAAPSAGGTGFAEAHLFWWSPSQTKQIIPQSRLFPQPAPASKVTAITSSLIAVGYVGTPFSFSLTSPDISAATTYALATDSGPLPPGLSLTAAGLISGTPSTAGTYNVAVNATNPAAGVPTGSSVINFTIYPTGSVTREILSNTSGPKASQIVLPADNPPPAHDSLTTLDDDTNRNDLVGVRLRGYIVPPKTGNYYFWIAASNSAELWISNDSQYANKVRRASVSATTAKKTWNANVSQQSPWLALEAGQKYYFEVLHNTGNTSIADDHVAVGWCQDDIGTVPSVAGAANPTGALTLIPNGGGPLQGYPLSGTVPSYIFQPYDYPVLAPPTGTLYASNLGPQSSAITSASGSVNLQINAAQTQAVLRFSYQNLTSPRTAYHLHVDSFTDSGNVVHPQGEIIFDIDDADGFPPELRTSDGGYIWDFAPTGSFTSTAQILEAIQKGKVYLNVHSVTYPAGEIRGTLALIDGAQTAPDASLYPEPAATDLAATDAGAARFLNHATFGASPSDVAYVKANGFAAWINDQFTKPASRTSNDVVAGLTSNINDPYPSTLFTNTWWKNSITGQDQLRQRLAFALSEIMVVSWANNTGPLANNGRVLADYYDQLVDYCLPTSGLADSGTFRGLLKAVTLTPAMGLYLDMRANQKGDITIGRHPNENYAREIMQLFSIGIFRQWDDGRFILGKDAGLIPTYSQTEILGLSDLFTGWNYAQANQGNGRAPTNFGPGQDFLNPMVLVPTQHELKPKALLNNVMIPAATGQTPRVNVSSIPISPNPSTVNTSTMHGLKTGDTVRIAGSNALPATVNATWQVTVTSPTSFTIPLQTTTAGTAAGTVTGATVLQPTYTVSTVVPPVSGSQADNAGTGANHPYDLYGLKELELALDNIVNNDNTPPYICRQLIQRLVTSDPSPGYVYRVVQKFKDNGTGVRGDMRAVITQILLDGEARRSSVTQNSTTFGKQREPMLRLTGPARAFPAASYTGTYTQQTGIFSNRLRIITNTPNDFSSNFPVSLNFRGNYSPSGQTLTPNNVPTTTSYTVQATTAISRTSTNITDIAVGSPTVITTELPHGLVTGNGATISGVLGGTFLHATNGVPRDINSPQIVTVISANSYSVNLNCTAAPTSTANGLMVSNPCKVTTTTPHGMNTGDTVTISGVTGGNYNPTINGNYPIQKVDDNSFTIPVICQAQATSFANAVIVGGTMMEVPATGMVNVTYSQPAGSTTMTVNVAGPQTDVLVPGPATTIKSKVYLDFLSRGTTASISSIALGNPTTITTTAAHGLTSGNTVTITGVTGGTFSPAINGTFTVSVVDATSFTVASNCTVVPTSVAAALSTSAPLVPPPDLTDGVYEVQANSPVTANTFTVTTTDTPVVARSGNVLIPRIATSYTPTSGNTVVIYNTNVNHNLQVGQKIWVDVPVVGNPLGDAEYAVTVLTDEDHFRTSSTPSPTNGGTYPNPVGSQNGITIWPLVPAPLGRSGVVTVDQSSFNLGSTEGSLTQSPLNAPTVFNYFFPDYKFPGDLANAGLDSPEFQLTTDTNVTNLTNSLTNMIIGTGGGNSNPNGLSSFNNGGGSVVMSIEPYLTPNSRTSNAGIPTLVDDLANLLIGAPLEPATKAAIVNFVANEANLPYSTPTNQEKRDRVRAIIHLIITSAEYAVQK